MKKATEIFEKHWTKRTGKPLDETTKEHMKYTIEAINEALLLGAVSGSATPVRLQRSRKHKQISPNGLPIIYVGRPTMWGNPFTYLKNGNRFEIKTDGSFYADKTRVSYCKYYCNNEKTARECVIFLYKNYIKEKIVRENMLNDLGFLIGKNLSCWCAKDCLCHADILLELATKVKIHYR